MFSEKYDELKKLVEDNLLKYLPETEEENHLLNEAMKYSLEAGGKRIRPVLMLASCRLAGGDLSTAVPYACAIEFIHTYSLIHDDHPSMDNDDLRRGKPTNHKVFGDDMAILAGDGLLNSAMDVMFDDIYACMESDAGEEALAGRVRAAREISKAAGVRGMVAGQAADVRPSSIGLDDPEKLRYIQRRKTGALLRAAVVSGGLLGGAGGTRLAALTVYGEQVGAAFQIVDDILDVTGSAGDLGKNTGVDAELGKLTYPAVYGLEQSRKYAAEATEKAVAALDEVSGHDPDVDAEDAVTAESSDFLKHMALDLLDRIS